MSKPSVPKYQPIDIFVINRGKPKIHTSVLDLPWPETVPLLSYEQNISGEYGTWDNYYPNYLWDWVHYALNIANNLEPSKIQQMSRILTSLRITISSHTRKKPTSDILRAFKPYSDDWNYIVRSNYNIAWSLLGYTENQLPFINEAADYLLYKTDLPHNIVDAVQLPGGGIRVLSKPTT